MAGGQVNLVNLTKRFGDVTAVDGVSLEVHAGEFFSLLGPSGCGKTTSLRLVAGFEAPTSGAVLLDGRDVSRDPPNKRPVNTVFQSYALFPFLSVADNVAFGLKYKGVSKTEMRKKVGEALSLVQLDGYEKRRPTQLSGGQQQRVALARALVLQPSVLLLDEPLGALDAKLRRALQVELKALQERVGITFIYVTHDQEEALTMSDRLAVMSGGHIAQVGTPRGVYEEPVDAYVADFLGVSNMMEAQVSRSGTASEPCRVKVGDFELDAGCGQTGASGRVKLAIRPERVRLGGYGVTGENNMPAMVERVVFLGSATQVFVRLGPGALLQAVVQNDGSPIEWSQGSPVSVHLPAEALRVLPTDVPDFEQQLVSEAVELVPSASTS